MSQTVCSASPRTEPTSLMIARLPEMAGPVSGLLMAVATAPNGCRHPAKGVDVDRLGGCRKRASAPVDGIRYACPPIGHCEQTFQTIVFGLTILGWVDQSRAAIASAASPHASSWAGLGEHHRNRQRADRLPIAGPSVAEANCQRVAPFSWTVAAAKPIRPMCVRRGRPPRTKNHPESS